MRKGNVVQVNKQETFIDDPLTGILRQGARDLLAQALEMEIERVVSALCATATYPSVRYKPVLARFPWHLPGSGIGLPSNRSGSHTVQRYYRLIFGRPGAWNN